MTNLWSVEATWRPVWNTSSKSGTGRLSRSHYSQDVRGVGIDCNIWGSFGRKSINIPELRLIEIPRVAYQVVEVLIFYIIDIQLIMFSIKYQMNEENWKIEFKIL